VFLCSIWRPFLRPDLRLRWTARAAVVKAGRRRVLSTHTGLARPRLDDGEHAVML
jgi:hypothetical protein